MKRKSDMPNRNHFPLSVLSNSSILIGQSNLEIFIQTILLILGHTNRPEDMINFIDQQWPFKSPKRLCKGIQYA